MSTSRIKLYTSGAWKDTLPSIYYDAAWKDVRAVWVYDGSAWKIVVTLKAPSAADNTVVTSLVGGVFSHDLNFSWTSFVEQTYASGIVHVYLDGVQITQFGFTAGTSHSENYTIPDTYRATGGSATAKVAYLPTSGSTEGTLSPASNAVAVVPW